MTESPDVADSLLTVRDAIAHADSRAVAIAFSKQHKNVIRDIRRLHESAAGRDLKFGAMFDEIEAGNGAPRKTLFYHMDEEALMVLVFGFTGTRALAVKRRFIQAFREMTGRVDLDELRRFMLHLDGSQE
ncbi:Rha family transcriptional regulator [Paraburkholderia sp. J67]|uniref:Rha family transcriptional regulator n=1 Tax=Paraburkholderia sp. J67 TaxID=2805435 RepID=UPI002ABD6893|nr:Rha family transcriptional regulator [Paraburkholderia sp. J67]